MRKIDSSALQAILFDVYGTLVEIGDKRAPFRQLLHIGARQGRLLQQEDASLLMGRPVGFHEAAKLLGIRLTQGELKHLESDLRAETASIEPFADTVPTLQELKRRGFKVGLCSNLARDYAAPVIAALTVPLDARVWSFDAGAIKPNPAIYELACRQLNCTPGEIIMVGDTIDADVEGPRAIGMQALLLDRKQRHGAANSIHSLAALLDVI